MAPQAVWNQLSDAIQEDQWELAGEIADGLYEWLTEGVVRPKITGKPPFDAIVARSTCEGICTWDV